jgi:aminodeoxyfutalosine deaminase
MALLYARKTPVEVSLLSNLKTAVVPDLSKHPLLKMLAWGVPVSLSTDDPGVFRTTLAQEYELAQRTFNLSWEDLKEISRNGIRRAFCDPKTKKQLLRKLDARIAEFEKKWSHGR